MANLFLGFPVSRAKIADMIVGAAPPLEHKVNHQPDGSDPLALPGDMSEGQLLKWNGSKYIGVDEPAGGMANPYADLGFHFKTQFPYIYAFKQNVVESGSITHSEAKVVVRSGETQTASAYLRKDIAYPAPALSFDRDLFLRTRIYVNSYADTAPNCEVLIGALGVWKHVGFAIWGGYVQSTVHNGTTRRQQHLTQIATGGAFHDLLLEVHFTAGEKAEFYVDGVLELTETDYLPAGDFHNTWIITISAQNVSTTRDMQIELSQLELYQAPA